MPDVTLDFTVLDPGELAEAVAAAHDEAERAGAAATSGDPAGAWRAAAVRLLEVHLQHESNRRLQAIAAAHTLPMHLVTTTLPAVDDPSTLRLPALDGLTDAEVERLAGTPGEPAGVDEPGRRWVAQRLAEIRARVRAELDVRTGRPTGAS